MQAEIEDYEDLKTLRDEKAISHSEHTRSLDAVIKDIGSLNIAQSLLRPQTGRPPQSGTLPGGLHVRA